jgi:hypothetical protein
MLLAQTHRVSHDHPAIRHDVLVHTIVVKHSALVRAALPNPEARTLLALDLEIHLKCLDLVVVTLRKPSPLFGGILQRGEDSLRLHRIAALDDKSVMNDCFLRDC